MEFLKKYGDIVVVLFVVSLVSIACAILIQSDSEKSFDYGIADQVEQVRSSVVYIEKEKAWSGSGCIISEDGLIFTAKHVLTGGGEFKVVLDNGKVYKSSEVIVDKKHDVGFIRIHPDEPLPAVDLADMTSLRVGDGVFIMGSPRGIRNINSVSLGILSADNRNMEEKYGKTYGWTVLFQSDATSHPGNSGGPVFNMDGDVIGVLVAGYMDSLNYSVPVAVFMDDIHTVRMWFELSRFEILDPKAALSEDDYYGYLGR